MDEATFAEIRAALDEYSVLVFHGDLAIWDNRAVLHRATAYDTLGHKRLMQRTTVNGGIYTTAQPKRYELAAE
jgi:hypothetical protein